MIPIDVTAYFTFWVWLTIGLLAASVVAILLSRTNWRRHKR
jgi:hypothetical protein